MIKIRGLKHQYGNFRLNLDEFNLSEGECQVIIGPTGSGKTLILESVLGLRDTNNGEILIANQSTKDIPIHKRNIVYVPQDLALFPNMNVRDNIFFGLQFDKSLDREREVLELCNLLQIEHLLGRKTQRLSGGERQRVALARALAPGHKLLLLDEPFSALHEGLKKQLWFELKNLQKKLNLSILLVTHDMEEAFYMGDKLNILIDGRIHQSGNKEDIYYFPKSQEVANFMGVKNLFHVEFEKQDEEFMYYRFTELNKIFRVPQKARIHCPNDANSCVAGIRAIEVMVLNPKLPIKYPDNLLEGNIQTVFNKGAMHSLLFKPSDSDKLIEIELPNHAYKKLKIHEGMQTKIFLKANSIFLVPNGKKMKTLNK